VKPERRRWCSSALRALLATSLFALLAAAAGAQPAGRVDVYLFWAFGCPHCECEIDFLKRLEAEEPRLRVRHFKASRVAMMSLRITGVTTRYVRFSHLTGGEVLLALGALLLLRPEWLMFG